MPKNFISSEDQKLTHTKEPRKEFIKPYIMESTLIRRINTLIDEDGSDTYFNLLSASEMKQAVRNRILDMTEGDLQKFTDLKDKELYNSLIKNLPEKYFDIT